MTLISILIVRRPSPTRYLTETTGDTIVGFVFMFAVVAILFCVPLLRKNQEVNQARQEPVNQAREPQPQVWPANTTRATSNEAQNAVPSEQDTRSERVKSSLEFRKILASSSPRRTAVLGPPLEADVEQGESNAVDNINRSSLELLVEMGFTTNASQKALRAVGGLDTEAALNWIFEHQDDPDFDDDGPEDSRITPSSKRLDSASVRSFMTSSMHFLTKVGLAGRNNSQRECCSICLEEYKVGDTVARLKRTPEQVEREKRGLRHDDHIHDGECSHWFHDHCITEWLQNHDECPLCRVEMVHS